MSDKLVLAVDLGTSGMKVALVAIDGRILGWDFEPVRLILTEDGGAEQSPEEWWSAFLAAATRLLGRDREAAARVVAICCSTQGEGTVPVDAEGRAIGNCLLWMDMRGAPHLRSRLKGPLPVAGVGIAKLQRFLRLTGAMPSMTGKDPAGHMLFIRETRPEIYERTDKFLNVLDYLNLRLTGRLVATFDSILTSWVTDNRDPDRIRYDDRLISILGLDRDKLPDIVPCTEIIGPLLAEVTERLGLPLGTKVVAGSIDTTAAAIGSGAVEDYAAHLYVGTSSWIAAHVPFKKTDLFASMASVPCAKPGRYLLIALQATAGGNLTFLRDNIIYHKDELLQEAEVPDIFKVLDRITSRVPAGANGLVYTPWIWGERAPVDDLNLRAGLFNLSLRNTREDIIRAFLEGIALNTRWLLSPAAKFMGRRPGSLAIAGGGAQSEVWCQIFADVLDLEIRQVEEPLCANTRGAAWIGAVGLGELGFSDLPGLVRTRRRYEPDPANRRLYDDRFEVFTRVYSKMKGIYKTLNG
jgi:xylulokinase